MKKMNFILKLFVLAVIVVFTACSKDEKASPVTTPGQTLSTDKTATITGIVHAQLIDSVSLSKQFVPQNTNLLFTYSLKQFYSYLPNTPDQIVEALPVPVSTTDGRYTITVPATNEGVTITLQSNQFEYAQHTFSSTLKDSTVRKIYTLDSQDINGLVPGETRIIDLNYSVAK